MKRLTRVLYGLPENRPADRLLKPLIPFTCFFERFARRCEIENLCPVAKEQENKSKQKLSCNLEV